MATVVYNYFSENFGYVNNHNDIQYQGKYESFSTKDLKKSLKKLKLENGEILEIKFVAKKLRNLLNYGWHFVAKFNNVYLHSTST